MKNKILFILRGGEVERFHTVRTLQTETVGHHSFLVAWFCWLLMEEGKTLMSPEVLLMAALAHDLAEHIVGDMPSPAKRELGIGEKMNALEDRIAKEAGFHHPLSEDYRRLLKLADCFAGMVFCVRERSMGNRGTDIIYGRYRSYVMELAGLTGKAVEILGTIDDLWKDAQHGDL